MTKKSEKGNNIIGIIPCAGKGTRLGILPFSKELFPLGEKKYEGRVIPKVACDYLIDHMVGAGIEDIHFILRKGKWDIPNYYGGGLMHGFKSYYHIADYTYGVPFSINQAFPIFENKIVVLGFPDILFKPENAFNRLLEVFHRNDEIDIVLGVMPVLRPEKWDMVELDNKQNVKRLIIKSINGKKMQYGWTIAAWKPRFSRFLNNRITSVLKEKTKTEFEKSEIYFGHIIMEAINKGLTVKGVIFENGKCLDIGTPGDLIYSTTFLKDNNENINFKN